MRPGLTLRGFPFLLRRGGLFHVMTKPAAPQKKSTDRARRDARILKAAAKGQSAQSIERALKAAGFKPISRARLLSIMQRAPGAGPAPLSDDFLTTELERLGELQKALHTKALKGDNAAVDRVLAILDRRAKLLGVATQAPAQPDSGADAKTILKQKLDAMAARLARKSDAGEFELNQTQLMVE